MSPEQFSQALHVALKAKYGHIPSCQRLVDDLYTESAGTCSLSAEAARKWLNGKTTPRGVAYIYLEQLLSLSAHLKLAGEKQNAPASKRAAPA